MSAICQRGMDLFNSQIVWRERVHGTPLATLQKIKAARAVSHTIFPHDEGYGGRKGHSIREIFRKEILKTVGVDYKKQTRDTR
ncbi:MAG: hypothetical protein BA864_05965 [Desulfuromonadales bacterium C00003093]|nr:MAG: hypothetical protein BA864_05965 [Desulfuromonadales bacterium C00003093]